MGIAAAPADRGGRGVLAGTAQWLAVLLSMALESFVVYLVCLLIFRVVLRKPWLATSPFFLVVALLQFVFIHGVPLAGLWIAGTLCLGTSASSSSLVSACSRFS